MFARVITAQAGPRGFDDVIALAERQLPGAQERPGFKGFYALTDEDTGKVITISFWETREQMDQVTQGTAAGIHDDGIDATGLVSPRLETFEVKVQG
jgi:heme-degrading monooxygenase HmoA